MRARLEVARLCSELCQSIELDQDLVGSFRVVLASSAIGSEANSACRKGWKMRFEDHLGAKLLMCLAALEERVTTTNTDDASFFAIAILQVLSSIATSQQPLQRDKSVCARALSKSEPFARQQLVRPQQ